MPRIDDLLASVIKGATEAGASVEQLTIGHEEKLANHGALGALAGGLMLPGIGAPIGAALGADEGQGLHAAGGSILGGAGGMLGGGGLGALLGGALGGPAGATLGGGVGAGLGGAAGTMYGAQRGGEAPGLLEKIRGKFSSAEDAYLAGSAEASARFKLAFLPLVGALAGPMLGRMALGRVAGGALGRMGGGAVGRMAGGMANAKGIGGAAVDMGASMAGQQMMS